MTILLVLCVGLIMEIVSPWFNQYLQWRIQELIDRGGMRRFLQQVKHITDDTYALDGSGGLLLRKILKSKASNDASWTIFRPKYGIIVVFETLNQYCQPEKKKQ